MSQEPKTSNLAVSPLPQKYFSSSVPKIRNEDVELLKLSVRNEMLHIGSTGTSFETFWNWSFFLNYHHPPQKRGTNKRKSIITRKERQKLDLLKIPKSGWNYNELECLREMWKDYMRENLDTNRAPDLTSPEWIPFSIVLAKSELIGAEITVVRSKVPNLVGMSGTIVFETKMTIQIVTPQSKLKILLKPNVAIQFRLDGMKFTIFGKYIATRPADKIIRKVKGGLIPQL